MVQTPLAVAVGNRDVTVRFAVARRHAFRKGVFRFVEREERAPGALQIDGGCAPTLETRTVRIGVDLIESSTEFFRYESREFGFARPRRTVEKDVDAAALFVERFAQVWNQRAFDERMMAVVVAQQPRRNERAVVRQNRFDFGA